LTPEPSAAARRSQQLPFGAAHRLARGAAERIEYVCGRNDADEPMAVEHWQGANQPLAHEVSRFSDRGLWLSTRHVRRHQILDPATGADIGAGSTAEIALGEDTDEPPGFHDNQVANAATAHPIPSFARRLLRSNGYNPRAHYLAKPHRAGHETRWRGKGFVHVHRCYFLIHNVSR
jgi:hypothetical protein